MSCSPFDLRDYALQELADPHQRQQVESHVKTCQPCREELDRLQLTRNALLTIPDEEIPQRIAFVSDQVFEPSPWRRGLAAFWNSSARLAFASAAMLSIALVTTAMHRSQAPAPAPSPVTNAEIERRVQTAADNAAREIEARYAQKTEQLVKAIQLRDLSERKTMMAAWDMQSDYQLRKIAQLTRDKHDLAASATAQGAIQ